MLLRKRNLGILTIVILIPIIGIAKVDESASEAMPAPTDPATDLSKAMGAGTRSP